MLNVLRDRNNRYSRFLVCSIILCILAVCIAGERPEFDKLSYTGSNNVSSIASPGIGFYDVVSDEAASNSVIKNIASKEPAAGRTAGSGAPLTCAAENALFILTGAFVLFLLYFYRDLATSHYFIITYIHNLDGMKP